MVGLVILAAGLSSICSLCHRFYCHFDSRCPNNVQEQSDRAQVQMDNCQIKDSTPAHTIDIPLPLYTSLAAEHPPKIRRSLFAGVQYLAWANAAIISIPSFEFFQGVRKNTSNFLGYFTKTRKPLCLCFLIACRLGSPTFDSLHPVRSRRNKVGRGSLFYHCQSPINVD